MDYSKGQSSSQPLAGTPSPLSHDFLRRLGDETRIPAEGRPGRKRGPKRDTKPALTARQEHNRLAQRTHRQRKENYLKSLELEIQEQRLKYQRICREFDAFEDENSRLIGILSLHGVSFDSTLVRTMRLPEPPEVSADDETDQQKSEAEASPPTSKPPTRLEQALPSITTPLVAHGIDYTQFAKDFVRSLELPCQDHQQMRCTQALGPDGSCSGHALMATCPPDEHCRDQPDVEYPFELPELSDSDLVRLFDLNQDLPEDVLKYGECSPIQAWKLLYSHEKLHTLSLNDLLNVQELLMAKIRCYGYGAVLATSEVANAVDDAVYLKECVLRTQAEVIAFVTQ